MKYQINDRVLTNWSHDEYWYPATITNIEEEKIYVKFDDGDKEWTTLDKIMDIDIEVGDRIYAKWQKGDIYYPGKIQEQKGEELYIVYDDGDEEWNSIRYIRVTR